MLLPLYFRHVQKFALRTDPHNWDGEEKKALHEFIKVTYGLTGDGGDNTMCCFSDIRAILFLGFFYACTGGPSLKKSWILKNSTLPGNGKHRYF